VVNATRNILSAPLSRYERLKPHEVEPATQQIDSATLLQDLGITVLIIVLVYLVLGLVVVFIQYLAPMIVQKVRALKAEPTNSLSVDVTLEKAIEALKLSATQPTQEYHLEQREVALVSQILEHQMHQEKSREKVKDYTKEAIFIVFGAVLSFFLNKL
jgi:hypothetical protein